MISETTYSYAGDSLLKSSDINKNVWLGYSPGELIREGYTEAVDFAPSQGQNTIEVGTKSQDKNEDKNDTKQMTPIVINYHDGLPIRLSIPTPAPENRHWVTMHALQEWEGFIVNKGEKNFVARLRDLTAETPCPEPTRLIEEEATIPLDEISDDDLKRIRPGSIFRWVIGYERAASGTKRRISQIVFRDLPSVTEQDKSEAVEWARSVLRALRE